MSTSKKEWDDLAASLASLRPRRYAEATWGELAAGALEDRDLHGLGVCLRNSPGVAHLVAEILQGKSAEWKLDLKWKLRGAPRKSSTAEKSIGRAYAVVEADEEIKQEARVEDVAKKRGVKRRTVFKDLKAFKALEAARASANKSRN